MIDARIGSNIPVDLEANLTGKIGNKDAFTFHINGRREAFTSTTTFNDIGDGIGIAGTASFPVLTGVETIQVVGGATDTLAGTGVQQIKVTYINTSYELAETSAINMNGTTAVNVMVGGMLQWLWFEAVQIGSNGTAGANITLRTSTPTVLSVIRAGSTKSMDGIFMVPDFYTGYLVHWGGENIANSQDFRILATVNTLDRSLSSVYKFQDNHHTPTNTENSDDLPYLKLPARSKIKISTISSSTAATTRAAADMSIILIKD